MGKIKYLVKKEEGIPALETTPIPVDKVMRGLVNEQSIQSVKIFLA